MNPESTLAELRATVAAATTPTKRAHALNQLAAELRKHGQYTESLAAAEEAYSLAKQAGELVVEAVALQLQGIVHSYRGSYSEALRLFEQSLKLREELGERSGAADVTGDIGIIYYHLSDYQRALEYYTRALAVHEELGSRSQIASVTGNIGLVYNRLSDYGRALEYYSRALALHEELGNRSQIASANGNIGIVYYHLLDYGQALEYCTRSLALYEELGERSGAAGVTMGIGNVYNDLSDYGRALEYYSRALALHEELGERSGVAITTTNIGNVYYDLSDYGRALEYYTAALSLHQELGDRSSSAVVIVNTGELYAQKEFSGYNPTKAEELLLQAVVLSKELGTKDILYNSHQALAKLYEQEGRFEEALQHFKNYHELYQEVQSEEAKKKALQVEQQRQIAEMEKRTAAERARAKATEELLHKTLPPSIADRMIAGEQKIADRFDSASILFADVVGFTPMTASMPASVVLEFMNFVFAHFDSIAAKHGCERIKTIGDGYMAVCGAPIECEDHAERIARMAMEMLEDVELPESITEYLPPNTEFEIRVGLHSGSITGGVIGVGKLAYDIYGDAVNTASRMESHGEAGKIHVSQEFAEALFRSIKPSSITLEERGFLAVKGKGQLRTYFLRRTSI